MRFGVIADGPTREWCVSRDHPFITYNPWVDVTTCRCAERQAAGEQPQDAKAKHEVFHSCTENDVCRCYVS